MSGGLTPSVHLFSQSRGKLVWNEALQAFVAGQSAERERSAGACRGIIDLALALADGAGAGADARAAARPMPGASALRFGSRRAAGRRHLGLLPPAGRRRKSFVDCQNDVTAKT